MDHPLRRPEVAGRDGIAAPTPDAGGASVRSMGRGGSLSLVGAVVGGALSFVLPIVVTRGTSSAAAAGAFFTAVAVYSLLSRITHMGAETGLVRFVARHRALDQTQAIRLVLRAGLAPAAVVAASAGVLTVVFAVPIARAVGSPGQVDDLAGYLRVLGSFAPVGALLYAVLGATRGFGTMLPTVLANDLLRPAGQLVLVGGAVLLAPTPLGLGLGYGVPVALALAVAVWWLVRLRAAETVPASGGAVTPWRAFWRFALPRSASGVFAVTISWLDVLLLGALASTSAAGIYAALTRYLVVGNTLQAALVRAFQPEMTRLLALEDSAASRRLFQTTTGWSMMLTWPAYVVMIVHAPALLRVFGEEYVAGATAMTVLALAWMVGTAVGPVDAVLVLSGRSALSMFNIGAALVVNLTLNILLIPRMGILGAAWAWSASVLVHNLLPLAQVWMHLKLHPFGRHTHVVMLLSAVCFGLGGWSLQQWVGSGPGATLSVVAITASAYALGLIVWRDRLDLGSLARALRRRSGA